MSASEFTNRQSTETRAQARAEEDNGCESTRIVSLSLITLSAKTDVEMRASRSAWFFLPCVGFILIFKNLRGKEVKTMIKGWRKEDFLALGSLFLGAAAGGAIVSLLGMVNPIAATYGRISFLAATWAAGVFFLLVHHLWTDIHERWKHRGEE